MICSIEDTEGEQESYLLENNKNDDGCRNQPPPLPDGDTPCFPQRPTQRAIAGHILDTHDTDDVAARGILFSQEEEEVSETGPMIPRCLAFDADVDSTDSATSAEHAQNNVLDKFHVISQGNNKITAVSRLKQRAGERQSSHMAALTRLKHLAASKQRAKIAAIHPSSTVPSLRERYSVPIKGNKTASSYNNDNNKNNDGSLSMDTIAPVEPKLKLKVKTSSSSAAFPATRKKKGEYSYPSHTELALIKSYPEFGTAVLSTSSRVVPQHPTVPLPNAAEETSSSTSSALIEKKPYLRRRSQAMAMQQRPDWSTVRPKTNSKLDENLILRPRNSRRSNLGPTSSGSRHNSSSSAHQQANESSVIKASTPSSNSSRQNYKAKTKRPWGNGSTRLSPSPFHARRRSLTRSGSALGGPLAQGSRVLTPAQKVARSTPFVPPPPTLEAYGPLGAGMGAGEVHDDDNLRSFLPHRNDDDVTPFGRKNGSIRVLGDNNCRSRLSSGGGYNNRRLSTGSVTSGGFSNVSGSEMFDELDNPLGPLVNKVEELLSSVERAISQSSG